MLRKLHVQNRVAIDYGRLKPYQTSQGSGAGPRTTNAFVGAFDGIEHTIMGLFGMRNSLIEDMGPIGVSATPKYDVGGVVEFNNGTIRQDPWYVTTGTGAGTAIYADSALPLLSAVYAVKGSQTTVTAPVKSPSCSTPAVAATQSTQAHTLMKAVMCGLTSVSSLPRQGMGRSLRALGSKGPE